MKKLTIATLLALSVGTAVHANPANEAIHVKKNTSTHMGVVVSTDTPIKIEYINKENSQNFMFKPASNYYNHNCHIEHSIKYLSRYDSQTTNLFPDNIYSVGGISCTDSLFKYEGHAWRIYGGISVAESAVNAKDHAVLLKFGAIGDIHIIHGPHLSTDGVVNVVAEIEHNPSS